MPRFNAREVLNRYTPPPLKPLVSVVRRAFARPPIDDVVLAEFKVVADPTPSARCTMVLPTLEKGQDFGGFATGIDIFARLCLALKSTIEIDVRVIITDVVPETDPAIVVSRAAAAGLAITPEQIELVSSTEASISVRADEVFMTYNWWTTLNFAKVRDAQAEMFRKAAAPLIWLMQDYEAAFMGFSSGHMLARAAYDTSGPLWGVINSSNLARYIEAMGHRPERRFVFEPVIAEALRPYLGRVASANRARRVLVYGRPVVDRNCFPALLRGLKRWVRDYPQFADWDVISAGTAHDPVNLGGGRQLVSVGKLSLEDYAELLLTSSVGVSLMASPHPSYPPLEMAHFGVRTVTNGYMCKDLSSFHPGITSLVSIAEEPLAIALADACAASADAIPPFANPDYVRTDPYPFLPELADAVIAELDRKSPEPA